MIHVYVSYLNYKTSGGKDGSLCVFQLDSFSLQLKYCSVCYFPALFFFLYILSRSKFIFLSQDYLMTSKSTFSPSLYPSIRLKYSLERHTTTCRCKALQKSSCPSSGLFCRSETLESSITPFFHPLDSNLSLRPATLTS